MKDLPIKYINILDKKSMWR